MTNPSRPQQLSQEANGGFKVENVEKDKKILEEEISGEVSEELPEEVAVTELAPETVLKVNEATVESICLVAGKLVVHLTQVPELAFDEQETAHLVNLWAPLLPVMPPLAMAILGTLVIVSGKVGVYAAEKRRHRGRPSGVHREARRGEEVISNDQVSIT